MQTSMSRTGAMFIALAAATAGCSEKHAIDDGLPDTVDASVADAAQLALDANGRADATTTSSDASNVPAARCYAFDNPSFENPTLTTERGSTTVPEWTQVAGNVDILLSGGYYGVAADGHNFIDINGTAFGQIEQTHPTIIGEMYEFSVAVAANGTNRPFVIEVRDEEGEVRTNQAGTGERLPTTLSDWKRILVRFIASSENTTVRFSSNALDDQNRGAMVDDFRCNDRPPDEEVVVY